MKKFTTILIAATFSAPVLATGVVDFGLGIDEGYKFGHELDWYTSQHVDGGVSQTSFRHIIDAGGGTDQAYTYERSDERRDLMLADEPAMSQTSFRHIIDVGGGTDQAYTYERGDERQDLMLSDGPAKGRHQPIDFGLGIEDGSEHCRC